MGSAVTHENQQQPAPFLSVPAELFSKVLWRLDSQSLLAIKLTCRALYQATKSRQLWHNFIRYFESITGEYPLEQPPTDYTVAELEQWAVRRLKIREQWQLPRPPAFTLREIDCEEYGEGALLPGGRWLVALFFDYEFRAWDLDEADPGPQVLFRLPETWCKGDYEHGPVTNFTLWMDRSTQCLTFHVALYNADYYNNPETYTTIYIYCVELEGHGTEAQFFSTPLIYMQNTAAGKKYTVLDGRRYIELNTFLSQESSVSQNPRQETVELHVYPYSDAHIPSDVKVKKFTTSIHTGGTLQRLSPDYIGIETYSCLLCVFSIAQLEESDPSDTLIPLYQVHLSLYAPLSPLTAPFRNPPTLPFFARGSDGKLVIAEWFRDFSRPPTLRRIEHTISTTRGLIAYGPSLAVFISEKFVETLSIVWDENSGSYGTERKRIQRVAGPEVLEAIDQQAQDSIIDVVSGRILASTLQTRIILDVAT